MGEPARESALALLRDLRRVGLEAHMEYEGRSIKSQMKRADRLKAAFALILGEDELAASVVSVKNMSTANRRACRATPSSTIADSCGRRAGVGSRGGQAGRLARTHTCGQLRAEHVGLEVLLLGWVHKVRDLGHLVFLDVRDRHGLTQVVFESADLRERAKHLRAEFVVGVKAGCAGVRPRR